MGLTQVSTDGVKNDAITKTKIPANQIEASELADNAVDTNAIQDDAVTEDKLANSINSAIAANTAKTSNATHTGDVTGSTSLTIADQAVTLDKLPHGDSNNNGKFLRANNGADPSFETVSIPAGTTINNNADNRVITGSGTANTLNGESGLLFDGTQLQVGGDSGMAGTWGLEVNNTSNDLGTALIAGLQGAELQVRDLGSSECIKLAANGQASIQSLKASDPMVFYTAPSGGSTTERMRIDSSGKVGIGTTSPISTLHLHEAGASGSPIIQFSNGDTGATSGDGFAIGVADNESPFIYNRENTALRFAINNTERMRLRATTGGLMIGEDGTNRIGEPKLHIKHGGASQNLASFYFDSADDRQALLIRHQRASGSTFASMIAFLDSSGNVVGAINSNGNNTTNFATNSDYRLKENNVAISDGITRLKTLKPYRFNFKDTPAITVDGFFAHEVTAVPEAITGTKDETESVFYRDDEEIPSGKSIGDVKETVPKYQGIDQAKLVPLLTAALQEAIAKIETLETKVAALEAA